MSLEKGFVYQFQILLSCATVLRATMGGSVSTGFDYGMLPALWLAWLALLTLVGRVPISFLFCPDKQLFADKAPQSVEVKGEADEKDCRYHLNGSRNA